MPMLTPLTLSTGPRHHDHHAEAAGTDDDNDTAYADAEPATMMMLHTPRTDNTAHADDAERTPTTLRTPTTSPTTMPTARRRRKFLSLIRGISAGPDHQGRQH